MQKLPPPKRPTPAERMRRAADDHRVILGLGSISEAIAEAGRQKRADAAAFAKTPQGKIYTKVERKLRPVATWVSDALHCLHRADRVDALDSIMMARKCLDEAEKAIKATMPEFRK